MPRREIVTAEYRAPTAATTVSRYVTPGKPMPADWDADAALRWGFYANTFVYACVRAIAEDIAALPIRVGDPTSGDYDPNHPLAAHFGPPPGGPNPTTSARKVLAWSIVQRIVTGRVAWEIEYDSRGRPLAYWPLPSRLVKPVPTGGGAAYWSGFDYGLDTANPRRLPAENVFYAWDPSADDWRQPESRLQAMRLDVSVAVMSDRYDYAFLNNDSRPAAIVVHEAFAEADERRAWRRQFTATHQGPDNANRVAFAEAENGNVDKALDVQILGLSQRDAQGMERYNAKIRAICVGLGVPLSRLGDASGKTFANASEEMRSYWRTTILPKTLDYADEMSIQLLPRYKAGGGGSVFFDTSGVAALNESPTVAQTSIRDLLDANVIGWNEARVLVGLPKLPDDDRPDNGTATPTVQMLPPAVPDPTGGPLDAGPGGGTATGPP